MNETVVMWMYVFVIALAALFFATKLIAEKYSNKLIALLDKVLVLGLIVALYTVIAGIHQSTSTTSTFAIVVMAIFLIVGKRFLHNLKEALRIIKGK